VNEPKNKVDSFGKLSKIVLPCFYNDIKAEVIHREE